jgi:hypothetical protein
VALTVKNTRELLTTEGLKLKILIYGLPGMGKTSWLSSVPNIGIVACETGAGRGLLTLAGLGIDYCEPTSLADCDAIAAGTIFKDKDAIALDSLSEMNRTFIKDAALAIPRGKGNTDKRARGIPELDDYGVMAEITRKFLTRLLSQDKHVIVTATEKYDKAREDDPPGTESLIGPDLPGQMFLGSTAMFDLVLRMRARQVLRDPRDPKSRVLERFFVTEKDSTGSVVKSRLNVKPGTPILSPEEPINFDTGAGTFPYILQKVKEKLG